MLMRYIIIFLCFFFYSCDSDQTLSENDLVAEDTLSDDFSSPQLTEINKKILDDPGNAQYYHQRALVHLKLGRPQPSIEDSKRAIRIDSSRAEYFVTLVDAYFAENSTRQAKDLLERVVEKFPDNTEALLKLAELYWLVRQYQKGIDNVNKALKIDVNLARGYYIKGGIYRESGDTSRAISSLLTAIEQDNAFVDAFYDLGVIHGARKNPLGLQYYENVLRIDPDHQDAHYGRARLLQDLGKTDQAIEAYNTLLAIDSSCARCHYNIGALMLEVKKKYRDALGHFTHAIRIEPDNATNYFARGYTYSKLKEEENARRDYKMCLRLDPGYDAAVEGLNELDRKR